jgi:hypothetical protein
MTAILIVIGGRTKPKGMHTAVVNINNEHIYIHTCQKANLE